MNNQLDLTFSISFPDEILLNFFEQSEDKKTKKAMKCVNKLWSQVFNSDEACNIELGLNRFALSTDVRKAVKPLVPSNVFAVVRRDLGFYRNLAQNLVRENDSDRNNNELSVVLSLLGTEKREKVEEEMKIIEKKRKREEREASGEVMSPHKKAKTKKRLVFGSEELEASETQDPGVRNMSIEEILNRGLNGEESWKLL